MTGAVNSDTEDCSFSHLSAAFAEKGSNSELAQSLTLRLDFYKEDGDRKNTMTVKGDALSLPLITSVCIQMVPFPKALPQELAH